MQKFEVDALFALLVAETAVVFFVLTVILFFKNKKLKSELAKLTQQKTPADNPKAEQTETSSTTSTQETKQADTESAPTESPKDTPSETAIEAPLEAQVHSQVPPETPSVSTLTEVVNLQKNKIAELMGYKDLFENAQKRLSSIQGTYVDLQQRIDELTADAQMPELQSEIMRFEANNNDLKSFMEVLDKENNKLAEQFIAWENKLAKLYKESQAGSSIDDAKYSELLEEKERLVSQIKEFEQKLQENMLTISDMQKQYEDLENEYMTLYRQQQESKPSS